MLMWMFGASSGEWGQHSAVEANVLLFSLVALCKQVNDEQSLLQPFYMATTTEKTTAQIF
jgi:hypothetical protein